MVDHTQPNSSIETIWEQSISRNNTARSFHASSITVTLRILVYTRTMNHSQLRISCRSVYFWRYVQQYSSNMLYTLTLLRAAAIGVTPSWSTASGSAPLANNVRAHATAPWFDSGIQGRVRTRFKPLNYFLFEGASRVRSAVVLFPGCYCVSVLSVTVFGGHRVGLPPPAAVCMPSFRLKTRLLSQK